MCMSDSYLRGWSALTLVQPFILDVITIWGANRAPPGIVFHFSSRGRNAKVSQYGPTAFVWRLFSKSSSVISSKYAFRKASAFGIVGFVNFPTMMLGRQYGCQ